MFSYCTSITVPPTLPAMSLAQSCYIRMFDHCTSLVEPPELPATTLEQSCYAGMFSNCTSMTVAPELPAIILAENCYTSMFFSCTSLVEPPELPATVLANRCYNNMFADCINLINVPMLPAMTLAESCYSFMFYRCTSLNTIPELPAKTLVSNCYYRMFSGCSSIKISDTKTGDYQSIFRIPLYGTGVNANSATEGMFLSSGGTFTGTPSINTLYYTSNIIVPSKKKPYLRFSSQSPFSITTNNSAKNWEGILEYSIDTDTWQHWDGITAISSVQNYGAYYLFIRGLNNTVITGDYPLSEVHRGWVLTSSSNIDCEGDIRTLLNYISPESTVMADYAFYYLFNQWADLVTPPYLTVAPELPATKLASSCYNMMLRETSIIYPPELPATKLEEACYNAMFSGCSSLVSAPELPATELATRCYVGMFRNCTSLTTPPALPAKILAEECYGSMFSGCTGLTSLPVLPAKELTYRCYIWMFNGCSNIKLSTTRTGGYQVLYSVPEIGTGTGTTAFAAMNDMFKDTGGTFVGTPTIDTIYYANHAPVSIHENEYLQFVSTSPFTIAHRHHSSNTWDGKLEYSMNNGSTWLELSNGGVMESGDNNTLLMRGVNNTAITSQDTFFDMIGSNIWCFGNIETLLDWKTVKDGGHPIPASYAFRSLFWGCTPLVCGPKLSEVQLVTGCIVELYYNCTNLSVLPIFKQTRFDIICANNAFYGCTNIKLSTTQTGDYQTFYRLPIEGTGSSGAIPFSGMFSNTGGTFTGTPTINTTYYTSNAIV